jgi:hypothetical protein
LPTSYRELKDLPLEPTENILTKPQLTRFLLNATFWSYDSPQALQKKMAYIKHHHLGGMMFWEVSQDSPELELLHGLSGKKS